MKKKLLVIFLFAIIVTFFIYKISYKEINRVLFIGNQDIFFKKNKIFNYYYKDIDLFLYDKITYKELIRAIKTNDYKIVDDKEVYLTQLMNKSSTIIILINEEKDINNKYELIRIINRISSAKIIIYNDDYNTFSVINDKKT